MTPANKNNNMMDIVWESQDNGVLWLNQFPEGNFLQELEKLNASTVRQIYENLYTISVQRRGTLYF